MIVWVVEAEMHDHPPVTTETGETETSQCLSSVAQLVLSESGPDSSQGV